MSVIEGDGGSLAAVPDSVTPVVQDVGTLAAAVMEDEGKGQAAMMGEDDGGRLDQDAPEPLWEQLAGLLRDRIARGGLTGRLEAETALALRYEVSRDTVRRALAQLHQEGLVRATRGRGTFVTPPAERGG
jgi:GntR family transcriptional regulator